MVFSVLIAHYNHWNLFYQDCYPNLLRQTFKDFEIVIVDDCSTDGSFQKLQQLAETDNRIKLFQNETNKGVGFTKRECVSKASGKICAFADPDDAIYETAIEDSISVLQKNDAVAAYSQIMLCDEQLKPLHLYPRTRKIKNGNRFFFNINNEVSHFFSFKKEAYSKTEGINPELTSSVDFDLYLKMYETGDFVFIEKPLYCYRRHQGGISQAKEKKTSTRNNWNKVLYDTCVRRNISKIGKQPVNETLDLAKVIFERENSWANKLKRKLF